MSGGYQPLATYGARADVPVEEARFEPGVDHEDLMRASRFGASSIRPADGFQSLIYLHDGQRHRVLAFWQNEEAIHRFHLEQREHLLERERVELPESPWITRLDSFRRGVARRQLMGPRMSLEQTEFTTPSPPAPALIYDTSGVRDIEPVLGLWHDLVPLNRAARIQDYQGFMFYGACDFGEGNASIYLAFRDQDDCESFKSSDFTTSFQERAVELLGDQEATLTQLEGHLLGWTVRQID